MKHRFHFLLASTLLLGLFIILNVQKSEPVTQLQENPAIAHIELQAAVCSNRTSAGSVPVISYFSEAVFKSRTDNLRQFEYLNRIAFKVRRKTQKLRYLELKPGIVIRSGQKLYALSGYEDPPLS